MKPSVTKRRHGVIREAITGGAVRTQEELVEILLAQGFTVTQATVSRDITLLGISKIRNRYVLPDATPETPAAPPIEAGRILRVERAGPHLLVVRTGAGEAGAAGLDFDRSGWREIVGTIAGDDTVFIACRSGAAGDRVQKRIDTIIRG